MYTYKLTFLGGYQITVQATSPRQAQEYYSKLYDLEVINVRWIR